MLFDRMFDDLPSPVDVVHTPVAHHFILSVWEKYFATKTLGLSERLYDNQGLQSIMGSKASHDSR